MDKAQKKAMAAAFLEKKKIGGIFAVECDRTNKRLILSSPDIDGMKGRFSFAKQTDSCLFPKLAEDWKEYGGVAFHLHILDTLEKKKDQTDAEFHEDIRTLLAMEIEKHDANSLY
jgi:hypothetical protein